MTGHGSPNPESPVTIDFFGDPWGDPLEFSTGHLFLKSPSLLTFFNPLGDQLEITRGVTYRTYGSAMTVVCIAKGV